MKSDGSRGSERDPHLGPTRVPGGGAVKQSTIDTVARFLAEFEPLIESSVIHIEIRPGGTIVFYEEFTKNSRTYTVVNP
jgi:hypothetical protein